MAEANRSRTTEIKDIYTAEEVATMLRMNESSIYALAKRDIDPLPLRRFEWKKRGAFLLREEFMEWIVRNAPLIAEAVRR